MAHSEEEQAGLRAVLVFGKDGGALGNSADIRNSRGKISAAGEGFDRTAAIYIEVRSGDSGVVPIDFADVLVWSPEQTIRVVVCGVDLDLAYSDALRPKNSNQRASIWRRTW